MTHTIYMEIMSDATFGLGDGVAGLVDQEIEHDEQTGLPFVRGRTLKGLLVEACADIFYALGMPSIDMVSAASDLFGTPGSREENDALMQIGNATFPPEFQEAIRYALYDSQERIGRSKGWLTPERILDGMTAIRRQTAVNAETDRPEDGSFRSIRVLMKGTQLLSPLTFNDNEREQEHLALLAACCAAVHRGGTSRNRGRGRLRLWLDSNEKQAEYLEQFDTLAGGKSA